MMVMFSWHLIVREEGFRVQKSAKGEGRTPRYYHLERSINDKYKVFHLA